MVGSKDLQASNKTFGSIFINNQFYAEPQWPDPDTDLSGKTAIVTGSNTGLGLEAARQLLTLKLSHLILAVRTITKGEAAAAELRSSIPISEAKIEVWHLDMCSYESIQAFARRFEMSMSRIDFVLLNAGSMRKTYTIVPSTGHEECIQVNYISTMLLTLLLLPILKAKRSPDGEPAHLTIVNAALSLAARFPNRNAVPVLPSFDDSETFDPREHYNSSKLLAHMFLWKLVDYISADDVIVNLADPAWCKGTDLARDVKGMARWGLKVFELLGRTKEVGASCLVDALVNKGKESHGCFLMSWEIHPFACYLYEDEGRSVTDRVWEETLAELDFAGVRGSLASMKR